MNFYLETLIRRLEEIASREPPSPEDRGEVGSLIGFLQKDRDLLTFRQRNRIEVAARKFLIETEEKSNARDH